MMAVQSTTVKPWQSPRLEILYLRNKISYDILVQLNAPTKDMAITYIFYKNI